MYRTASRCQVQAKPQGEVHRPQFGGQKEEVPLCTVCWILSDLLSAYGPVLSPRYGILRARHKTVHHPWSPETADLLHKLNRCYRFTFISFYKCQSCLVSKGKLGYKKVN